jgi:hypothetical protein
LAVAEHACQRGHLGQPTAVVPRLELDCEGHTRTVPSELAGEQADESEAAGG